MTITIPQAEEWYTNNWMEMSQEIEAEAKNYEEGGEENNENSR